MTSSLSRVLFASLLAGGCTVGAQLPFGHSVSTGGYYPQPAQGRGEVVTAETADGGGSGGGGGESEGVDGYRVAIRCVPDQAGPTFQTATPLRTGLVQGCIDGGPQTEIYSITAPAHAGTVLYEIKMQVAEHICASFYDEDRERLTHQCVDDNEAGQMWIALAPETTAYFYLDRTHSRKSAYALEVRERLLDDTNEPNDNWKGATPLKPGDQHASLLAPAVNDRKIGLDFYKVQVKDDGILRVEVDPESDEIKAEVTIFDADRERVEVAQAKNPGAVLRLGAKVAPGSYYIVVNEDYAHGSLATFRPYGEGRPAGHYFKPYNVSVEIEEAEGKRKGKRVSRR